MGAHLPDTPSGAGRRFAVVVARFNEEITSPLLEGCLAGLRENGVAEEDVDVHRVPGAWELPQVVARVTRTGIHNGVVALGCVIRGETPHFDFVAGEAAHGLGAVARASTVPVVFGVLTTDTLEQAQERAFRDQGDKGFEFALSALHLAALSDELEGCT